MREVSVDRIQAAVVECIERAAFELDARVVSALQAARDQETSSVARTVLEELLQNQRIAREERRPMCQDTGTAVLFVELGQEVHLVDGDLRSAVDDAVHEGYTRHRLRAGMVGHPLSRENTTDNTPAMLHVRLAPGNRVRIRFMAKGGGCENMNRLAMLTPAQGREGVLAFVEESVRSAGGRPCPPVVVGVGLGGTFERTAELAKEALLRPLGDPAARDEDAALEAEALARINALGVGPMGLGGRTTALAVHVESTGCHIASLPVAVNLDCHAHRHAEAVL